MSSMKLKNHIYWKATPKVGCPPVDGCKSKTKGPRDHDGLALPDHIPQIITNSGYIFFSDLILGDHLGIRNAHNLQILPLPRAALTIHMYNIVAFDQ